jgi:membrane-associated phospholipid phosphatase
MADWLQRFLSMPVMDTKNNNMNASRLSATVVGMKLAWRWGVPLVAALALAVLLLSGGNVPVFNWLNGLTSQAPDTLWVHLSLLGDGQMIVLFILPFLGRRPDVVWQYVLAIVLGGIFVHVMKEVFSTPRPPAVLLPGSFHLIGPDLQNNAFPSGHTTTFFILAGLVCLQQANKWLKSLVLLLAILGGLSRIASGVHWPLDVMGAALGGWLVAMATIWLAQHWQAGLNRWMQRIFALLFTGFSIWAVWTLWHYYENVYPGTGWLQLSLLIICLAWSVPGQMHLLNLRRS